MQSAKDTFYVALRDRLAALDSDRTVVIRGAVRPAVVVEENELEWAAGDPVDAFLLRWTDVAVDATEPLPLHAMTCEVRYATRGTGELSGMDRGRVLDAMDVELRRMLEPRSIALRDFSVMPPVVMETQVFWSDAEFAAVSVDGDKLMRVATVRVFSLQEKGAAHE